MNPQPSVFVSNIFTFIFVMIVLYYFLTTNVKKYSDNFVIGHYDPPDPVVPIVNVEVLQPENKHNDSFKIDCLKALRSLGYKKSEANKLVEKVFSQFAPKDIQEFIGMALKHG